MPVSMPVDVIDTHIHTRQKPTGEHVYNFDAGQMVRGLLIELS